MPTACCLCLLPRHANHRETFDPFALFNTAVCLAAAFGFGTLIGAERQYR
jgi:hypothetical protein